jgi:UDP:flavonoid glycosyltransferase YjiC (YdhE family)
LATMGSWGDIFPVIGLAKGLTAAGHDVRVAASPAYEELRVPAAAFSTQRRDRQGALPPPRRMPSDAANDPPRGARSLRLIIEDCHRRLLWQCRVR